MTQLKVGDKVIVFHGGLNTPSYAVTTVAKLTPKTVQVTDYIFYRSSLRFERHLVFPYSEELAAELDALAIEFASLHEERSRLRYRVSAALDKARAP